MTEGWAVLQDIYMIRIAEIEAARDELWGKCERYQRQLVEHQAEINRLQARVKELEERLSVSSPS